MESDPWLQKCFLFLSNKNLDAFVGGEQPPDPVRGAKIGGGGSKIVFELEGDKTRCIAYLKKVRDQDELTEFYLEAAKTSVVHYMLSKIIERTDEVFRPKYYARVMRCYSAGLSSDGHPYMILERIQSTLEHAIQQYCPGNSTTPCTDEQIFDSQRLFSISLYQITKTLNLLYKEIKFVHADMKANNVGIFNMENPCLSTAVIIDLGMSFFEVDKATCATFGLQEKLVVTPVEVTRTLNNDVAYLLVSTFTLWSKWIDSPTLMTSLTAFFNLVYYNMSKSMNPRLRHVDARWGIEGQYTFGIYDGDLNLLPDHLNQKVQLLAVKGILTSFVSLQCVREMVEDEDGYLSAKTERLATLLYSMVSVASPRSSNNMAEVVHKVQHLINLREV
jgi:hypothetical protein